MGWRQKLPELIRQQHGHCFGWWLLWLGWAECPLQAPPWLSGGSYGFAPAEQRSMFQLCGGGVNMGTVRRTGNSLNNSKMKN